MPQDDPTVNEQETDASGSSDGPGPIRALTRGLDVLEALNAMPAASVTDIARAIGLPRTTAYRVLETLCAAGFAERSGDERYRLLAAARRLADGYDDEAWIERVARPATAPLAKELAWPLTIATLHGTTMRARRLGDVRGGDIRGLTAAPFRLPLFGSSLGIAYLAACPDAQRRGLMDLLRLSGETPPPFADAARGYALVDDGAAELSLAVPVTANGAVLASLAVTFARTAVASDAAPDRFTALLSRAASDIAAAFEAAV